MAPPASLPPHPHMCIPYPNANLNPNPNPPRYALQTQLGWAWTDRHTFAAFQAEAAAAPPQLQPTLK